MTITSNLLSLGYSSDDLDDIVQDAASQLASNANNGGLKSQVEFLTIVCGWSSEDIQKALDSSHS